MIRYGWIWLMLVSPVLALDLIDAKGHDMDLYGKLRLSASHVDQSQIGESLHVSDHKTRLGLKGVMKTQSPWSFFLPY